MRNRILLTRPRAAAIVTCCYVSSAIAIDVLIHIAEAARGEQDPHRFAALTIFRLLCASAWLWSMTEIWGRRG